MKNHKIKKINNQQFYQELYEHLKKDGATYLLPQNLIDEHIDHLIACLPHPSNENDNEINLAPIIFIIGFILYYQKGFNEVKIPLEELIQHIQAYQLSLVLEKLNRKGTCTTEEPTLENIFDIRKILLAKFN